MNPEPNFEDKGDLRSERAGLPVPDPHNDVSLTLVETKPQTPAGPSYPRWPLLVILVGVLLTLVWDALLGWVIFSRLVALF